MKEKWICFLCLFIVSVSVPEALAEPAPSSVELPVVWTLLKSGRSHEAGLATKEIQIQTAQGILQIPFADVLSLNTAGEMSEDEKQRVGTSTPRER